MDINETGSYFFSFFFVKTQTISRDLCTMATFIISFKQTIKRTEIIFFFFHSFFKFSRAHFLNRVGGDVFVREIITHQKNSYFLRVCYVQ